MTVFIYLAAKQKACYARQVQEALNQGFTPSFLQMRRMRLWAAGGGPVRARDVYGEALAHSKDLDKTQTL